MARFGEELVYTLERVLSRLEEAQECLSYDDKRRAQRFIRESIQIILEELNKARHKQEDQQSHDPSRDRAPTQPTIPGLLGGEEPGV